MTEFEISFYGDSATPLFTAHIASPLTLTSTLPGTGNSGFVFQIAPNELAAANAVLASTTAIGAGFTATNASGGQDTVFLETSPAAVTQSAVPEPANYGLLGIGLISAFLIPKVCTAADITVTSLNLAIGVARIGLIKTGGEQHCWLTLIFSGF